MFDKKLDVISYVNVYDQPFLNDRPDVVFTKGIPQNSDPETNSLIIFDDFLLNRKKTTIDMRVFHWLCSPLERLCESHYSKHVSPKFVLSNNQFKLYDSSNIPVGEDCRSTPSYISAAL